MKLRNNFLFIVFALCSGTSFAQWSLSYGPSYGHYDEPSTYKSPDLGGAWIETRFEGDETPLVTTMDINWRQGRARNADTTQKESSYGDAEAIEGNFSTGWRFPLSVEGLSVIPNAGFYAFHERLSSQRIYSHKSETSMASGSFNQGPTVNLQSLFIGAVLDYQLNDSVNLTPYLRIYAPTKASIRRDILNAQNRTEGEELALSKTNYVVYGMQGSYKLTESLGLIGGVELSDRNFKMKDTPAQPFYGTSTTNLSYQRISMGINHNF